MDRRHGFPPSHITPEIFTKVLSHIKCTLSFRFDTTQLTEFSSWGEQSLFIAFAAPATAVRSTVSSVAFASNSSAAQKTGFDLVCVQNPLDLDCYSTAHFNGTLLSGKMNSDLLDDAGATCPTSRLSAAGKANPRQDGRFQSERRTTHSTRIEYYNRVLWYSLEVDARYLLLDGFRLRPLFVRPFFHEQNKHGDHEGYRSLYSGARNQLIAVTGISLVFPVVPG